MLKGKKIILCVTGSIAAYKAVYLLRLLVKEGAEVQVVMTAHAADFVSPLTFSTLSGKRVMTNIFEDDQWENHAILARWADLIIIAPATAQTIARMANGFCDNLVMALYLSAVCPVMVAPAMDEDMWLHPSVRRNVDQLDRDGVRIIEVNEGELASGLTGKGRMAEPEDIVKEIKAQSESGLVMKGRKVLITSGPTREPIDPVRYISNHSTGKMGIALAHAFAEAGAEVTIVTGPTDEKIRHQVKIIKVNTASEMFEACMAELPGSDIIIMAAAVADYTPVEVASEKMKKSAADLELKLKPTRDILAEAGKMKKEGQVLIGFALESEDERQNALLKLKKKNADFIVLNSLRDKGAGFGVDTNKVTIFERNGKEYSFPLKKKDALAHDILLTVDQYMKNKKS